MDPDLNSPLIGYVTDVEGNWNYWCRYIATSKVLYAYDDTENPRISHVDLRPG